MLSYAIAAVVIIGFIAILSLFTGKRKGKNVSEKDRNKTQAQIMRAAGKRLAKDPHDPQGLIPMGEIYYERQMWEKAYAVYDELTRLAAKNNSIDAYQANVRLGVSAVKLNKLQEAINPLSAAFSINPRDFDVNYYLGLCCYKSNQYEKAIPCFKKALVAKPDAEGIYAYLGNCLYNTRKFRDSLPCFKKALDEDPQNKEVLFCMADAMTEEGHGEKAIKVFMHLRPDPVYGAKSSLAAGIYHKKVGDTDGAIQDYEIGLKHENAEPQVRIEIQYNLAQCYFEKNQVAKGVMLLKAIREVNASYKDVNALINRYQELSQNTNLNVYLSAGSSDFVTLCRKFISKKYKNSTVKIQDINVGPVYTDILADIATVRWEDVEIFRFFRTTGSTGEIYVRDFHGHMQDVKADRGFCVSAGTFSQDCHKYIEGRPLDLIEKNDLTKILKLINI